MSDNDSEFMKIMQKSFADIGIDDYFIQQVVQYRPVLRYGTFVPMEISTFNVGQYKGIEISGESICEFKDVEFFNFDDALDYVNEIYDDSEDDFNICFDPDEHIVEIDNFEASEKICEKLNELLKDFDGLEDETEV